MFSKSNKHRKISISGLGVVLLLAMAMLLRVTLIWNGWPPTNSDEGVMGLMALHILKRGEWPIYFYGQSYLGTIDAYLGAFFFRFFGPSLFALRLGLIVLYIGFLLVLYRLACLLYSKGIALVSVFFLCLGSSNTLAWQLFEGYPEPLLFGALPLLLASWLALSFHPNMSLKEQRIRSTAYGWLGVVIGLGIWSHLLVLPFVGASLLLIFLFCRSEVPTIASLYAILGYLLGSFPVLLFNMQHPGTSLLLAFLETYKAGSVHIRGNFGLSLLGTIVVGVPMATGANPLCPPSSLDGQWIHQFSLSCGVLQGCWGSGIILLHTLAAFTFIREIQKHRRAFLVSGSSADRNHLVRWTGRLMLLASADVTLLLYMGSPVSGLVPHIYSRYLVGLLVATPVIASFLLPRLSEDQSASKQLMSILTTALMGRASDRIKVYLLSFIGLILIFGTVTTFPRIPDAQYQKQREDTLIKTLQSHHTLHIYSDYWTCNRIIFESNEGIICASLNKNLEIWENRYEPYLQIVQDDPHPAYVFHIEPDNITGLSWDGTFGDGIVQEKLFASRFGSDYHRTYVAGYAVYLPVRRR
jgi:hypothetical protein